MVDDAGQANAKADVIVIPRAELEAIRDDMRKSEYLVAQGLYGATSMTSTFFGLYAGSKAITTYRNTTKTLAAIDSYANRLETLASNLPQTQREVQDVLRPKTLEYTPATWFSTSLENAIKHNDDVIYWEKDVGILTQRPEIKTLMVDTKEMLHQLKRNYAKEQAGVIGGLSLASLALGAVMVYVTVKQIMRYKHAQF